MVHILYHIPFTIFYQEAVLLDSPLLLSLLFLVPLFAQLPLSKPGDNGYNRDWFKDRFQS